MNELTLAALSFERRTVALAVFTNSHLENVLIRHLPEEMTKAMQSLTAFLNITIDLQHIQFMVLPLPTTGISKRAEMLNRTAVQTLRIAGIPLIQVSEQQLLESYGLPSLESREQLRRSARTIWPSLNNVKATHGSLDAALLGLHVQIERLLSLREVAQ